ncbi:calponin homology domain-containing protein DDB_G0272472-like isoform X2 [Mercenaria mercenaria]|uniref:calponin homology domain-containing protein DDB_G0272472-like isoform X2 n=1 Tax=Mercenaria mercenaria TaxID=6596 RepID=UPI00234E975D|nr:calponin homology domain-containing protein DDB_G0272472-like isoform X2 [Mercenaria mercenaria]
MRKIRLSDTDLELFDIEIGPTDYLFYQRHKDAFKTMWREQGKPFWTRFQITFRSFTVKHGIIKQMNIDSPKFQNLLDQAFIFIHEHFVDGKESTAKNFIDDVARLAQNQDKFPALDSKSFAKDPFFARDTRELFRKFFGLPDQKSSYLKVYILSPVYLRFGGSVCRCLIRWMEAPQMDDPNDDSYWVPPQPNLVDKSRDETIETTMCSNCVDDCGTRYFREKIMGSKKGPTSMDFWTLGDPRFKDGENPLFAPHLNPDDDWRDLLTVEMFRDFYNYAKFKYGSPEDKCKECQRLKKKRDKFIHVCKQNKKKKKQETKDKEELIKDLKEVRNRIDELEEDGELHSDYEARIQDIIKDKPRVREALEEAERKEKLEKLHNEQIKAEEEKQKVFKKTKRKASPEKKTGDSEKLDKDTKNVLNEKDDKADKKRNTKEIESDTNVNGKEKDSENETVSRESSVEKELGSTDGTEKDTETEDSERDSIAKSDDEKEPLKSDAKDNSDGPNEKGDLRGNIKDTTSGDAKEGKDIGKSGEADHSLQKDVFNEETTKSDHTHYSFLSDKDLTANKNIVSGFKVIKIEDADNGLFEVNVSAACLKSDDEEDSYTKAMKEKLKAQELNNFILSANLLREKISGLPQKLEWWEGRGFAVAIVNFEEEEKEFTKKWTNFTLKINGYEENAIKQTLIQLLIYVSKRKRRICYGWNMEVDDVVACILPEESPAVEDLSISISRGFRFEDRLTEFEKESLLKHYPNLNLDLVLTGIEKGAAVKALEKKGGKEKLRKIIEGVAEKELFAKDLPVVDVEKLRKKLYNKEEITKADILWEQLIRKPENFEFFVLLEKECVLAENDWWKLGMRTMDIRAYNDTKNPDKKICPICKTVGMDCSCEKPVIIEPKVVEFVESSDFEKVKVLGDEDGPQLPKMKYTETNLSVDKPAKSEKKSEKKSKTSKSAKKKEKRIELSDLPAKFLEAGIDADKTTITIPSRDEEPMMGKVPIPVSDKLEKLAPVPGVQSSLNFTFQNGKKEQTITVTLGAYMPEDKINEIQEKKGLLKILEEEEKRRNSKATGHTEKKEKKDKKKKEKKEKPKAKSPQKSTAQEEDEDNATKKEKTADITTRFLQEIFADEEKLSKVTKTIHQHMGLSNKRQAEKKAVRAQKKQTQAAAASSGCTCPHHDEIQKMKEEERRRQEERKEKLNDIAEQLMDVLDNKNTSRRYRENFMPKVEKEEENDKKCAKGEACNFCKPKENGTKAENGKASPKKSKKGNAEVERADEDKLADEANDVKDDSGSDRAGSKEKNGVEVNGDVKDVSSDERESMQAGKLRKCGNCDKIEPARKAFKKCQKCKDEGVLEVRYYCSRECQVDDWKKKHKMEHRDGLLG